MRRISLLLLALSSFPVSAAFLDGAHVFDKTTHLLVNRHIEDLKRAQNVTLNIESSPGFPPGVFEQPDEIERGKKLQEWASQKMRSLEKREARILINVRPELVVIAFGEELAKSQFGIERRNQLSQILTKHFEKREFGEGISTAIKFINYVLTGRTAEWELDVPPVTTKAVDRILLPKEIVIWLLGGLVWLGLFFWIIGRSGYKLLPGRLP